MQIPLSSTSSFLFFETSINVFLENTEECERCDFATHGREISLVIHKSWNKTWSISSLHPVVLSGTMTT